MHYTKKNKKFPLRRYHYQVYFPEYIDEMYQEFAKNLKKDPLPTNHGVEQFLDDKRGTIPLVTKEELFDERNTLVEVYERLNREHQPLGKAQKLVIRVPHLDLSENRRDYTYVIAREGYIVTAWANDKNDHHRLTERNNYYDPNKKRKKNWTKTR